MENKDIIEKLNTIGNMIDSLRQQIIKEDSKHNKTKKTDIIDKKNIEIIYKDMEKEYKKLALKYNLPINDNFIENVLKIAEKENLTLKQIDNTFNNIMLANEKNKKDDLEKYTYSCLYRANNN